jgi:hypothetical protein
MPQPVARGLLQERDVYGVHLLFEHDRLPPEYDRDAVVLRE